MLGTTVVAAEAQGVLLLIRASGMPGFRSSDDRVGGRDARGQVSEDQATAAVLNSIRAAGLRGFRCAGGGDSAPARSFAAESRQLEEVSSAVQAAGLSGFAPYQRHEGGRTAPKLANEAPGERSGGAPTAPVRLSRQEYVVLAVAPGGHAALAELEGKMGMAFAADDRGGPYWSESIASDGTSRRAFSFMAGQRVHLSHLLGDLGSTALRLSVEMIDRGSFRLAGTGAGGRSVTLQPQIPPALLQALHTALRN